MLVAHSGRLLGVPVREIIQKPKIFNTLMLEYRLLPHHNRYFGPIWGGIFSWHSRMGTRCRAVYGSISSLSLGLLLISHRCLDLWQVIRDI